MLEPTQALSELPLEELIAGVLRSAIEGPHEFIRALDREYDRRVQAETLARALPQDDDLRVAVGAGARRRWAFAQRLPWDSEFFGYGVARVDAVIDPTGPSELRGDHGPQADALREALNLARSRDVRYVFSVVAARDLPMIRALSETGFQLIETRGHYHKPLTGPPPERFETRVATAADIPSLARAAASTVNHFDRFHADPAVDPADADRLMQEWVEASITRGFADVTIVPDVDEPEAFCTARYHREHWDGWGVRLGQPVLSAVAPRHRGWYVRIISELNEHLRSVGADHSWLITQITNNAVIRSWEKLGYQFGKGEHVFRALL